MSKMSGERRVGEREWEWGERGEQRMVNSECSKAGQGRDAEGGGQWLDGWLAGTDEEL